MIAWLEGVVREKAPTAAVLNVGGVGYQVSISLNTYAALPDEGKTVSLRIHTHVREDALQLFGFHTDLERALFEELIRINGVGPKLAQAVLSGIRPPELVAAIAGEDVGALRAVPGVGSKTAQRILVELRDRVGELGAGAVATRPPSAGAEPLEAVVSALINLGTARASAERAARAALETAAAEASLESVIRDALRRLAR